MSKRYRLTGTAQIDGALQGPGYIFTLPDGAKGPLRAVSIGGRIIDEPLYVEVDEAMEKERLEMAARHKKELEDLDGTTARNELIAKHAAESAAYRAKVEETETAARHEREAAELERRQKAEDAAFEARAKVVVPSVAPAELAKEDLDARHKREAEELAAKQEAEDKEIADRRAPEEAAKNPPPKSAPSEPVKAGTEQPAQR